MSVSNCVSGIKGTAIEIMQLLNDGTFFAFLELFIISAN